MTESELLERFNVSICEFSSLEWPRNGFLDPVNRVVYINGDLPPETRLKVILHELGHLEHTTAEYTINPIKCENEANRAMIHALLKEELEAGDASEFNYVHFMERHKLKTTADELMVIDEYYRLVG